MAARSKRFASFLVAVLLASPVAAPTSDRAEALANARPQPLAWGSPGSGSSDVIVGRVFSPSLVSVRHLRSSDVHPAEAAALRVLPAFDGSERLAGSRGRILLSQSVRPHGDRGPPRRTLF